LLELELPFPVEKNESFQLKLSNSARDQWKSAQIIYPENLIGCGSNSKPKLRSPNAWLALSSGFHPNEEHGPAAQILLNLFDA
jgi:hypothetical protein